MKNKLYIIFMALLAMQSYLVNASMHTKDKIDVIEADRVKTVQRHEKVCWICQENAKMRFGSEIFCFDLSDINYKFYGQVDELVLRADDLTHLEKLNYLYADVYFGQRKEIIKDIIKQGTHPEEIVYQVRYTPMKEAILFKDETFKQFLIEHGATQK